MTNPIYYANCLAWIDQTLSESKTQDPVRNCLIESYLECSRKITKPVDEYYLKHLKKASKLTEYVDFLHMWLHSSTTNFVTNEVYKYSIQYMNEITQNPPKYNKCLQLHRTLVGILKALNEFDEAKPCTIDEQKKAYMQVRNALESFKQPEDMESIVACLTPNIQPFMKRVIKHVFKDIKSPTRLQTVRAHLLLTVMYVDLESNVELAAWAKDNHLGHDVYLANHP
jgi:hypothetical protein